MGQSGWKQAGELGGLLFFGSSNSAQLDELHSKCSNVFQLPYLYFEASVAQPDGSWPINDLPLSADIIRTAFQLILHRNADRHEIRRFLESDNTRCDQLIYQLFNSAEFRDRLPALISRAFPDSKRIWHVHIAKTAGSSIVRGALRAQWGIVNENSFPNPQFYILKDQLSLSKLNTGLFFTGHVPLRKYAPLISPFDLVFCFVRNPIDRIVSYFNYIKGRMEVSPTAPDVQMFANAGFDSGSFLTTYERGVFMHNEQCSSLSDQRICNGALSNARRTGCQLLDVSRFGDAFVTLFGEGCEVRENESHKYLDRNNIEPKLLTRMMSDHAEDAKLVQFIQSNSAEFDKIATFAEYLDSSPGRAKP